MDEVKRYHANGNWIQRDPRAPAIEVVTAIDHDAIVARLTAQLPDCMQNCTIIFMQCERGHGWLTATNWVPFGCPQCQRDALQAQVAGLKEALGEIATMPIPGGGLAVDAYMASIARAALAAGPEQRAEQPEASHGKE